MKTYVLRVCGASLTIQPIRTKIRHNSAETQQATSSATVIVKNDRKKFTVCDNFVEFMVRKHQEELQRLSTLIREEAIQRYNSYLQVLVLFFQSFHCFS